MLESMSEGSGLFHPGTLLLAWLTLYLVVGLWPFNFHQSNLIQTSDDEGLSFRPPSTVYTSMPTPKLLGVHEFTIITEIKPGERPFRALGTIVIYGTSRRDYGFLLDERGESFMFHLATDAFSLEIPKVFQPGVWKRIMISGADDSVRCYVDGILRGSAKREQGVSLTGQDAAPIVFGSEANGDFFWEGNIRAFSLYAGALKPEGPMHVMSSDAAGPALLQYAFNSPTGSQVPDLGFGNAAPLTIPEPFMPYHRVVLRSLSQYFGSARLYLSDIVINIFFFIPGGYLWVLILRRRGMGPLAAVFFSTAAVCYISMGVEFLQAFVPTRNSSAVDVLNNTFGGFLGAVLAQFNDQLQFVVRRMFGGHNVAHLSS
jgi:hypothetical protein